MNCPGSSSIARAESDGRTKCPYCGHRINVTGAGRMFGHSGRRASAPRRKAQK